MGALAGLDSLVGSPTCSLPITRTGLIVQSGLRQPGNGHPVGMVWPWLIVDCALPLAWLW